MHPSISFALCVALAASLYQVFQRQTVGVNAYIVAISVSGVAILLGLLFSILLGKLSLADFPQSKMTWLYLACIGLCAFSIDFFTSKSYTAGGNVSVIGPVITCGAVLLSGVFGAIFFKEPLTLAKLAGFALMAGGIFLTSWKK